MSPFACSLCGGTGMRIVPQPEIPGVLGVSTLYVTCDCCIFVATTIVYPPITLTPGLPGLPAPYPPLPYGGGTDGPDLPEWGEMP